MGSEAEVVRESRPGFEYPAMWLLQYATHWDHDFFENEKDAHERFEYEKKCDTPCRLIRIPSESPATKRGEEVTPEFIQAVKEMRSFCHFARSQIENEMIRERLDGTIKYVDDTMPKESPCSSGSQGGGGGHDASSQRAADAPATTVGGSSPTGDSSSRPADPSKSSCASGVQRADAVASNPPAWATPQILAACKPGDRLYWGFDCGSRVVRVWPGARMFKDGRECGQTAYDETDCLLAHEPSYTIPTPPPDKPKPEAKCDGSGRVENVPTFGQYAGAWTVCPGCPACRKPIRCDKCSRRRGTDEAWATTCNECAHKPDDAEEVARKKRIEFKAMVKILARRVISNPNTTQGVADLAREVLAMMEER